MQLKTTNMTDVACCLIENPKGEYLLAQKNDGSWEFPGGKKHLNENILSCAEREIKEELNLLIKADLVFPNAQPVTTARGDFNLLLVHCRIISGKLELKEHQAISWEKSSNVEKKLLGTSDLILWSLNKNNLKLSL